MLGILMFDVAHFACFTVSPGICLLLSDLLEENGKADEVEPIKLARMMYKSCMDLGMLHEKREYNSLPFPTYRYFSTRLQQRTFENTVAKG